MQRIAATLLALALPALVLTSLTRYAVAAEERVKAELHSIENGDDRCRVTFVVQNKTDAPIESFKLDLVMFRKDGSIDRRVAIDLAPLRGDKTMVRTFAFRNECGSLHEVLVNDVTACSPLQAEACVDGLALSSRVQGVRFYK